MVNDNGWRKKGSKNALEAVRTRGLQRVLAGRPKLESKDEVKNLVAAFLRYGAKAVLLIGAQRGGDFLNNQLRGQWAEKVAFTMSIDGWIIKPFGPTGAAMPGEEDHREVIMTFKEIDYLEGKRPDLLVFETSVWQAMSEIDRRLVDEWPERRLTEPDREIVRRARCGVEVKNSTWHYATRRNAGGGPLSITVKDQEIDGIRKWSDDHRVPVVFVQVLFDELYCMSFRRMTEALLNQYVYRTGDYVKDKKTGAGKKMYHRFLIEDEKHLLGKVTFPDQSKAEVRVLGDGNVVPYIAFHPAEATNINAAVIIREVEYQPPTPVVPSP